MTDRWRVMIVLGVVLGVGALAWLVDRGLEKAPSGHEQATQAPAFRQGEAAADPSRTSAGVDSTVVYDSSRRTFGPAPGTTPSGPGTAGDLVGLGQQPPTPFLPDERFPGGPGARPGFDVTLTPPGTQPGSFDGSTPNGQDREPRYEGMAFRSEPGSTGAQSAADAPTGGPETGAPQPAPGTTPSPSLQPVPPGGSAANVLAPAGMAGFPKQHVVQDGDRLWDLAGKYYSDPKLFSLIVAANPALGDGELIRVGMKLTIPAPPVPAVRSPPSAPGQGTPGSATASPGMARPGLTPAPTPAGLVRYVVREGDTLYRIAVDRLGSGARVAELLTANPGLDPQLLKVGQSILVPAGNR